MAGIHDGQQAASNGELQDAILQGHGHVYYGLAAASGLVLYALLSHGPFVWLALVFVLVLLVGCMVDLYAHGYTH